MAVRPNVLAIVSPVVNVSDEPDVEENPRPQVSEEDIASAVELDNVFDKPLVADDEFPKDVE